MTLFTTASTARTCVIALLLLGTCRVAAAESLSGELAAGGGSSAGNGFLLQGVIATGLTGASSGAGFLLDAGVVDGLPPSNPSTGSTTLLAGDDLIRLSRGASADRLANGSPRVTDNDIVPSLPIVLRLLEGPSEGTLTLSNDGRFRYIHGGGPADVDQFLYELVAGEQRSTATVRIEILSGAPEGDALAVAAPPDLTVTATGFLTPVALGIAEFSGSPTARLSVSDRGPFRSGLHQIVWTVSDDTGRLSEDEQLLTVLPTVHLPPDGVRIEGLSSELSLYLSDRPPSYPVSVPFKVGGTAQSGADHDLVDMTLRIEQGLQVTLPFVVFDDGPGDAEETLVIELTAPDGASLASRNQSTDTIVEMSPPVVEWSVQQQGVTTRSLRRDAGIVKVSLDVYGRDNPYRADWRASDPLPIDLDGQVEDQLFEFDPENLPTGLLQLRVTLIGADGGVTPFEIALRVFDKEAQLSASADRDGDGIVDALDGEGDNDLDGVPDWLDGDMPKQVLATRIDAVQVLQADLGVRLGLGVHAYALGLNGAAMDAAALEAAGIGLDDHRRIGAAFDYVAQGLRPGSHARIVLPLDAEIPKGAVVRKWTSTGWVDFELRNGDRLRSAPMVEMTCPAPGGASYRSGLQAGDRCLELTLSDGGPNDADGAINGVIRDPVAIAVPPRSGSGAITRLMLTLLLVAAAIRMCGSSTRRAS